MHLQRSQKRQVYLLTAPEYLLAPDNSILISEYPCFMHRFIGDPDPGKRCVEHIFALAREDKLDQLIYFGTLKPHISISNIIGSCSCRRYLELDVVDSINGLFCLSFNWGTCIVLWNPITRQSYQVPDPQISYDKFGLHSIGFAKHNGLKVVRLVTEDPSSLSFPTARVRAEVYVLKTNTWSEILDPPQVVFSTYQCGTILKGVPYWPMDYDVDAHERSEWIISFSSDQRAFTLIKRPDFNIGQEEFTWRLRVMGDSLVTFVQKSNNGIDVWMKMDDFIGDKVCWTKQITFSPVVEVQKWVGCWENMEFLVANTDEDGYEKEFVLYDRQSNEVKMLPLTWSKGQESAYIVSVFSESLVSPFYIH